MYLKGGVDRPGSSLCIILISLRDNFVPWIGYSVFTPLVWRMISNFSEKKIFNVNLTE